MSFGETVVAVECANLKTTLMYCAGKMCSFQMSQHVVNVTNTMSDSVKCTSVVSVLKASCNEKVALEIAEVQLHTFLISAMHSSEWSDLRLGRCTPVSDGEKLFWPLNQLGLTYLLRGAESFLRS